MNVFLPGKMFNDELFSEGLAATLFQMAGVEEFLQRESLYGSV